MPQIKLIRAYDQAAVKRASGYKILVDRLWPRGLAKADLPYQWGSGAKLKLSVDQSNCV
ncbi:DUF488 family protein [Leuconostoc lactis]|uniref:DUF488 family protein, N3 subclade n=1 Tax=Leuconostoc lactis TaxID=1246 RepID=UPI001FAA6244|nr:DUF488 family protein [Leuconostoc lactis]